MSTSIKSEGFNIRLVLPASTSMDKIAKKILHAVPKGSSVSIKATDYSLRNKPVFSNTPFNKENEEENE